MFSFVPEKQLIALAYNFHALKYQNNDIIFKQGDTANAFYLIAAGQVQVQIPGKQNIILKQGESFGENCLKIN